DVLKELVKETPPEYVVVKSDTTLPDGSRVRVLEVKKIQIKETTPPGGGEPKLEQILTGTATRMKFNDLKGAALDSGKRESLEGQTVILEGRFQRLGDKEFQLFRMKMACCAADAVPLKVRIIVPQALSGFSDGQWVEVKGQLQFRQPPGRDYFIPV